MNMVNGNQGSNSHSDRGEHHYQHQSNIPTISGSLSSAISSTKAYFNPFNNPSSSTSTSTSTSSSPQSHPSTTTPSSAGQQSESSRLLTDVAPHLMHPRMIQSMNSVVARSSSSSVILGNSSSSNGGSTGGGRRLAGGYNTFNLSISHPARSLGRISNAIKSGPITSNELRVLELSDEILAQATLLPDDEDDLQGPSSNIAKDVSLFRGFQATLPSNLEGRNRRRKQRGREVPKMGLRAMGDNARGLLTEGSSTESNDAGIFQSKEMRKARRSLVAGKKDEIPLGIDELQNQVDEISNERENLNIRRMLINNDISEVEAKISALESVKRDLEKSLLGLREEELELNDEFEGVSELLTLQKHRKSMPGGESKSIDSKPFHPQHPHQQQNHHQTSSSSSSRRRKGPLFLPSEHDELPSGVAFMTLANHNGAITGLDFSEPYGTLVSSSVDETVRVWDLSSGMEVGKLRGHRDLVKCLQVEDELCITGSSDHTLKLWDLRRVEDFETRLNLEGGEDSLRSGNKDKKIDGEEEKEGIVKDGNEGSKEEKEDRIDPCLRTLEGHSKGVTALYFDDNCLVTGASDKTLRQWDLNTGQCVLTMDILWAISNPTSSQSLSSVPLNSNLSSRPDSFLSNSGNNSFSEDLSFSSTNLSSSSPMVGGGGGGGSNFNGTFSYPTPPYSDGSWEMYQDFVGGIQFWGYALASGSGDGGVRMWDMRTGQAHRTLLGHTAPVTCLQFDENHIISGSLDKSIRIWDLRMGSIFQTVKFDYPITDLQFDSRKIMTASGENGIKVFNRTTGLLEELRMNGHLKPVERLRYMDRYAVSGGKDSLVKVWSV